MQPWEAAQFGLLDEIPPEYAEMPEYAGLLASMLPGIGDVVGFGADAVDFAKEPSWEKGLLGAAGALPFVPSGLGSTNIVDLAKDFAVYVNPNKKELYKLCKKSIDRLKQDTGGYADVAHGNLVRWLQQGDNVYAWPAVEGVHVDTASWLKDIDMNKSIAGGIWDPKTGMKQNSFKPEGVPVDEWEFW